MALTEYYVTDAGAGDGSGSSEANAMSFSRFTDYMSTGGSYSAAAGDRFNIKGAITSRTTTADTWTATGTSTSPIIVRGYGTTPGDLATAGRTNGNGALIATNFPVIPYSTGGLTISGNYVVIETLKFTATKNAVLVTIGGNWDHVIKCIFECASTGSGAESIRLTGANSITDSDATLTNGGGNGTAALRSTNDCHISCCRVTSSSDGIYLGSNSRVIGCTVYKCGGVGIYTADTNNPKLFVSNTVAGCTGDGIKFNTTYTSTSVCINNCVTDNGGYGFNFQAAGSAQILFNNRTRDNASGAINGSGDWAGAFNFDAVTTDTGGATTDYTNVGAGTEDYTLISTSPAAYVGLPLYASIGALQRNASGGSGDPNSHCFGG